MTLHFLPARPAVEFWWTPEDMDAEQAQQASLFYMRQRARETPACCFHSDEFHKVRAELENSSSGAIRKHARALPIAYQPIPNIGA
jgi:hypothetical protein